MKGKNDLSVSTKNTKLKRRGEEENNIEYIGEACLKLPWILHKNESVKVISN